MTKGNRTVFIGGSTEGDEVENQIMANGRKEKLTTALESTAAF
jgi:hypothetical protein